MERRSGIVMKTAHLPLDLLNAAALILQELPAKHTREILNRMDREVRVTEDIEPPAAEPGAAEP